MGMEEKTRNVGEITDLDLNILSQGLTMLSDCEFGRIKGTKWPAWLTPEIFWNISFLLELRQFLSPFCTFPVRLWTSCLLSKNITIQLIFWKQWQALLTSWLSSLFGESDHTGSGINEGPVSSSGPHHKEQRPLTEVCEPQKVAAGDFAFELWIFK